MHYRPDQVLVDAAKLWPELWNLSSLGNLPGIYTDGEDAAPETCLTTLIHCNEELGSLCLKNKTRQDLHSSKMSQDVIFVAKENWRTCEKGKKPLDKESKLASNMELQLSILAGSWTILGVKTCDMFPLVSTFCWLTHYCSSDVFTFCLLDFMSLVSFPAFTPRMSLKYI